MDAEKIYDAWRKNPDLGDDLKKELRAIKGDKDAIRARFEGGLEFGTGGLRALTGAGTTRLNVHTVGQVTQGLADWLREKNGGGAAVAVAYDSRHFSAEFALSASLVLAANGIRAYLFDALRPTPELSFAVRSLGCAAGVVVTASHNPPEYSGYKVYGPDGCQVTPGTAGRIAEAVGRVGIFEDVRTMSEKKARKQGLLVTVGEELDRAYLDAVAALDAGRTAGRRSGIRIVYTPLHGAGRVPVAAALQTLGYENVRLVDSQAEPDGGFPTVKTPDPADPAVYAEAVKLAEETNADLILATDPDCDRLGAAVKNKSGGYAVLSGSELGALLTHFLLSSKKQVTRRDALVKTIVTSELGAVIAADFGASVFNTLTGFKYIGELIGELERGGEYAFLFGYEESCGYLAGTFVRDKDAVIAAALTADMAAFYLERGMTLFDALDALCRKYGYFADRLTSFRLDGAAGRGHLARTMGRFRDAAALAGAFDGLEAVEDYERRKRLAVRTGAAEPLALPSSDVVRLIFTDGAWLAVRPSGTEPKLKLYASAPGPTRAGAENRLNALLDGAARLMEQAQSF
jgi:phosphoglucomutase